MGDLLIRNISSDLKSTLAQKAAQSGRSLSEEAKIRLRRSLESEEGPLDTRNAWDVLRGAFVDADALLTEEEHEEFMRAVEEGRKDMGRPAPDFE